MELTTSSAAFLVATAAYLSIRGYFKRKLPAGNKAVSKSSTGDMALVGLVVAGQLIMPLLAIATPLLDWADYQSPTTALAWAGALLMAAGVWLFWRSHADLGENWSVTLELQEGHKLVSSGVYKLIRHPMYAAFFVMAAGQSYAEVSVQIDPSMKPQPNLKLKFRAQGAMDGDTQVITETALPIKFGAESPQRP